MQRNHASRALFAVFACAILALPNLAVPAAAAPAAARLDDDLCQRLQTTPDAERIPVIVEGAVVGSADASGAARAQHAESRVRGSGGHVVASSTLLGATVAELTPAQIRSLGADATIGRIHVDAPVRATALASDTSPTGSTPIVFQQTIGAPQAWSAGDTGKGVTVAVLDTGIDDNPAAFGDRVKARVDLVDPAHPAAGDPAGHGTHIAGIVAASRGFPSPGVAPDASLVSVRVLDQNGSSRLSTIIGGLEWVLAHKASLGIRVVVMALGAPAVAGYREDPLAAVAELAWRSGLVVVSAAGNAGPAAGSVQTPGIDPLILTVGASDDNGTASPADDVVPGWSSVGPTPDGLAKPDLVAPGRRIVSVRVPGSTLDVQNPTRVEGPTTIRFSGTSEATGVAAGAAALLLQQRPELNPDQTKALLVQGAQPLSGASTAAQGAGLLNVSRSLAARTAHVSRPHLAPANGLVRALVAQLRAANGEGVADVQSDHFIWDTFIWDHFIWDHFIWDTFIWDHWMWDAVVADHWMWDSVTSDNVTADHFIWDQTVFD